jgi:hypothetical protein
MWWYMSEARFRRILLLVVLVIAFYVPGTLAIAAPPDQAGGPGIENSNGHGQGQDSPDDHDNGHGNDQPENGNHGDNGNANEHGQGQDSPDDHDNGHGNDDPPVPDPEPDPAETPVDPNQHGQGQDSPDDPDNGYGNDDPPVADPEPDLAAAVSAPVPDPEPDPAETPVDPNQHGQGQDSPDDPDNGYGNDDPPTPDPEPDLAAVSDPEPDPEPDPAAVSAPEPDPEPDPAETPVDPNQHGQGQDSPDDPDNGYGNDDPPTPKPEPEPQSEPAGVPYEPYELDPVLEPLAGFSDIQPSPENEPGEPVPEDPLWVATVARDPAPPVDQTDAQNDSELAPNHADAEAMQAELPNKPPVATPGQTVVFAGSTTTIDLSSFVADADGDFLVLTSNSVPTHGTLTVIDGDVLFTPEPGFFGIETLNFTACDTSGACIDTTVSVFVPPVNDILIATNDLEILSRFMTGADLGLSHGELVADLLSDSAARLAVPMAGAVSVFGGSLLFGLHKIGTRFELLRLLLRRH